MGLAWTVWRGACWGMDTVTVNELLEVVQLGRHDRHLRLRPVGDPERGHQLVHPPRGHPQQVTGRHHGRTPLCRTPLSGGVRTAGTVPTPPTWWPVDGRNPWDARRLNEYVGPCIRFAGSLGQFELEPVNEGFEGDLELVGAVVLGEELP